MRKRCLYLLPALLLACLPAARAADLEIHFIDVGQGDCTLISCPNGNRILVDCGYIKSCKDDDARDYVHSQLVWPNPKIDTVVITHPDKDHYSLLPSVLEGVSVGKLMMVGKPKEYTRCDVEPWLKKLKKRTTRLTEDYYDDIGDPNLDIDCGEAEVYVLAADVKGKKSPKNTRSIVLMVSYGDFDAILTGDATTVTENVIMDRYGDWLDSELLKVGHHGSSWTSTSKTWADTVQVEVAVVSAGVDASRGNTYGHPKSDVIKRLRRHTVREEPHAFRYWTGKKGEYVPHAFDHYTEAIFSTATNGTIVVKSDGETYEIEFSN